MTPDQVWDWRVRALKDHRVVCDHIARYGEASARRLFSNQLVDQAQRLSRLGHLDLGCATWAGMSGGETSGVDLARVPLRAAREVARRNGGGQKAKRKPRAVTTARRDGREPMGLGAAIGEAGLLAAWSADPTDQVAVAAVAVEVRTAIEAAIATEWTEFQKITDPAALEAADPDAAARAQTRTAEHLLAVRLGQMHTQARPVPVRPAPRSQRLPELAARPLNSKTRGVIA
ncbi:hypothetical protein GCM10018785_11420 [Streptomyces longispororuber]|uniref:Uncharacterized protein n=1 Tax=Streptomyces longispororuber TaxID=68230 RepID=A0A918ZB54_9ACTN|nr:hypothetical protein [Streptomyces longispororuber]GHE43584.1 hypothetical protein GCM10018785_11420 [Streptomyces longispororuber]